jgi:hypothetical protein
MFLGYRIFRGYKELCNAAERLPDVTHVVFVVHGVGGIMDESTIGRNAAFLRSVHSERQKWRKRTLNEKDICIIQYVSPAILYLKIQLLSTILSMGKIF